MNDENDDLSRVEPSAVAQEPGDLPRSPQPDSSDHCAGCGGAYRYDTSIPSVVWNAVIRANGLPEYLCAACILREFAMRGESFTAVLWGEDGLHGVPIEVQVGGAVAIDAARISDENNLLRCRIRELELGSKGSAEYPNQAAQKALNWIVGSDTGTSSQTIWAVMMNTMPRYADVPHDPDDFGRCYRLLVVIPEWRANLKAVSARYKEWTALVEAWDELTALYEEEEESGHCPKLYARMRVLIDEGRRAAGWTQTGPGSWEGPRRRTTRVSDSVTLSVEKRETERTE